MVITKMSRTTANKRNTIVPYQRHSGYERDIDQAEYRQEFALSLLYYLEIGRKTTQRNMN